jgi:tRNA(fMet)-specific endonuclease VapC
MNFLLDTNILVGMVRSKKRSGLIKFLNPNTELLYISVATEAEIRSFAIKSNWGASRLNALDEILDDLIIIDIVQSYMNIYAQIDSFPQRSNPAFTNYNFNTPQTWQK